MNTVSNTALCSHLAAMGCHLEEIPEKGSLSWKASGDLFGDAHCIRLDWTSSNWQATRVLLPSGTGEEKIAWCIRCERQNQGRFRLKFAKGPALEDPIESISKACRWVKGEIKGLNYETYPENPTIKSSTLKG